MRFGLGCLILAVALLTLGLSQAEAAYRLTFQNGTSVEVQSYEDLGDAIRYQRSGGRVVVPKANVSAIEEAVHLPPPTPPGPAPRAPSAGPPNATQGFRETSRPPVNPRAPLWSTPVIPIDPPTSQWAIEADSCLEARTGRVMTETEIRGDLSGLRCCSGDRGRTLSATCRLAIF